MALKNIARRADIDAGVLRQRRDFYAIAIGLLLFNLAGGHLNVDGTVALLLPVKFKVPQVLFWAVWCGFAYFLWRFWLLAPGAWSLFWKEISLQAGNRQVLKVALDSIMASNGATGGTRQQSELLARRESRIDPGIVWHDGQMQIDCNSIQCEGVGSGSSNLSARTVAFPADQVWRCRFAVVRAVFFAIWYERSFSDYVAPYLFAGICIAVQIARFLRDPSFLG